MEESNSEQQPSPKTLLKQQLKKHNPDFRYYKSLFNMTSDLIAITDGDGIIDANKSFTDFFATLNIDVFDHNFTLSSVFQKIDKYGYVYEGYKNQRWFDHINQNSKDYYRVAIAGSKKLYDFNITIKKFEFSQDVFIVILTDITNIMGYKNTLEYHLRSVSKNKEETEFLFNQYNSAIDISNLVIKMDIDGNITYVNDAFCKALKYDAKELIYKNIKILCNPDETCDCYSLIVDAVKNSKIYKGVIENIDKDGDIHFFNATIVPIKNQNGEIVECLSIQDEITEMVRAKEEAIKALELKSKFFDKVSHELRTPLNAIINFTDQALDMYEEIFNDECSREMVLLYLQRAHKNSKNLLNLINSLLDLSKLKSTKDELVMGIHDVAKIVKESYESCSSLNIKEGVEYNLKLDFDSAYVRCDDFKLNQIVVNLISNALKFTQKGFVSVHLSEEENEYIIEIEDSGIGIPDDKISTIFEPFEQVRSSDNGTGLGLSIVKEYTNAMKMVLDVTSTKDSGSCFRLKINKLKF